MFRKPIHYIAKKLVYFGQFVAYRKIPKISPSMNKPLQIWAPENRNTKNPPINRPSEYNPPGGLYLEFALEYKVKRSKNGQFPSHDKLAQSILKSKFPPYISPSEYKPLQK